MKEKSEIAAFLRANVAIFAEFADEGIMTLLDGSRVVALETNEAFVYHGEKEIHLGVVLRGAAVAWVVDRDTGRRIRHVERGDAFGVMAHTVGHGITVDLVAESDCEVLLIPMDLFRSMIAMPMATASSVGSPAAHFGRR
jgi:CRP-like cAMP-binding protein